jgi:hypothetical protein
MSPVCRFPLVIAGAVLLSCAQQPVQRRTPSAVEGSTRVAAVSEEQAVYLAGQEARRRGWSGFEAYGRIIHLADGGWQVLLVRIPREIGAHALVEVSGDGKVVRWGPGM